MVYKWLLNGQISHISSTVELRTIGYWQYLHADLHVALIRWEIMPAHATTRQGCLSYRSHWQVPGSQSPVKPPFHYLRWTTSDRQVIHLEWRIVQRLCGVLIICVCRKIGSDLSCRCVKIFDILRLDRMWPLDRMWYILLKTMSIRLELPIFCSI